jgi:leucyl aminopeptidase (aminopeptidase T)
MKASLKLFGLGVGTAVLAAGLGLAPQYTPGPQTTTTTKPTTTTPTPTTPGNVDLVRLAQTLVNQCTGVRPNELVMIEGGQRDLELIENIAVECRKLGAHPMVTFQSEKLSKRMMTDVPSKFDTQEPAFALKMAETIDAMITIEFTENPDLFAGVPAERINAHRQAFMPVHETLMKRNVVQLNLGNALYPTKALADRFGVPPTELSRIFWNGVNCDYRTLAATGSAVKNIMTSGRTVQVTGPNGTNLTFDIAMRPVFVSDGVVSDEDRYAGGPNCQVWLPAGEVYCTPVPGTAKGTFVADNFFFEGRYIQGLTFKFDNGRLTSMTAKGDITPLKQRYDAAPFGKDELAAIDIGINPNVQIPAGSKMVTWMGAGTISVGIGGNVWAGGENACPFDVFAHLTNGTCTVDGKKIVDQGRLIVNASSMPN